MRAADSSITLLASGSMPEEAIIEGVAADWHIPLDQAGICSNADWTCGFLKHDWGNFDGVTEHGRSANSYSVNLDIRTLMPH